MEPSRTNHVSEDVLERYSMNRLQEPELADVEEHVLVCTECQDRLQQCDAFARGMRGAAAEHRAAEERSFLKEWWRPAAGVGLAATVLIVVALSFYSNGVPAAVVLTANRGAAALEATAPAGRPLALELDLTDIAAAPSYRVEIVDTNGSRVCEHTAAARDRHAVAEIPRLSKGRYFVRLYSPSSELLREYGLEAR